MVFIWRLRPRRLGCADWRVCSWILVVESIASIPGETRLEDRFFSSLLRFTRQAGAEDELHLD